MEVLRRTASRWLEGFAARLGCRWALLGVVLLPLNLHSAEDLEIHRFRFFLHPDLVAGLPDETLKSRLALYVEDLNTVFSKQTIRRFTFDPDTDITITANTPYGGLASELPSTNYEIWAHAVLSTNTAFGTYGGTMAYDISGAGVAAGLHWDAVHDRSSLQAGSGSAELTQYWRQIHHLIHEIEHIFGAGFGEYYDIADVTDSTGVEPIVDISYSMNGASDPYWSQHTDYFTDPLLLEIPALSYSNLMSQVRFANVTAAVINGRKRWASAPSSSLESTLPDLTRTKVLVRDTESEAPIPNAEVRIWKVRSVSPDFNESIVNTNSNANGEVEFAWSGGLDNFDQMMVIKVYHPGIHLPAVRWASIYDAQEAKMIGGQDHFEVPVLLSPDPGPAVAPFIVQQPESGTNVIGTTASFSVVADGTPPLSYQWQFNETDLADDGNILGSTNATLTISSVQRTNAGSYRVMVSNVAGTTNSAAATLSVVGLIQSWVNAATNGQVIPIPAGTYVENVVIDKDVTLEGAGPDVTIVDGNKSGRVFLVGTNRTVAISGLTIQNGEAAFATPSLSGFGGGLFSAGDLSLSNCVVRNNRTLVSGSGGGISSVGGDLTLDRVLVQHNSFDRAAGIFFAGGELVIRTSLISSNSSAQGGGGVYLESGTLDMTDSTVDGNASDGGGGIYLETAATAVLNRSTISRNYSDSKSGGGIFNAGNVILTNCTISGNRKGNGGAPAIANNGALVVEHSTITENQSGTGGRGGAIQNSGTSFLAGNSIIAGNTAPAVDYYKDVFGTVTSEGYNLIGDTNGATITGNLTGNLLGVDPLLGPLQDNGGPTWTHALLAGSPAIDQGTAGGTTTDQRGLPRPVNDLTIPNAADGSDMGAFELQTVTPVFPPVVTQQPESRTNLLGTIATFSVLAEGTLPMTYQWQFNGTNLVDGGNIAGSTLATLTISSVQRTNAGSYRVLVSNVAGGTNSETATLSVVGLIQSWVNAATNGQVIPIPAGTYSENVVIDKDVTLLGAGSEVTIVDGNQLDRVFVINTNRTVTISGITVQHGIARFPAYRGGGLYSEGDLVLKNCLFRNNGVFYIEGGGIYSVSGGLTISNSIVRDNEGHLGGGICTVTGAVVLSGVTLAGNVGDRGGGLYLGGGHLDVQNSLICSNLSGHGGGGLYLESGTLKMDRSVVDGNISDGGGGFVVGENGVAFVTSSTISRNSGVYQYGGGAFNLGSLSLSNCTVSGNIVEDHSGGGIRNSDIPVGSLTLESCTITGNHSGPHRSGGGVSGSLTARNTIIAGNFGDIDHGGGDISGTMTSLGYNLVGDTNGVTITGDLTGNLLGVDPLLGPLQDNGGPTWTHALLTGSPAIDQGSAGATTTDQRGLPRPVNDLTIPNAADGSDIGAFELQTVTPVFPPVVTQQPASRTNLVGTSATFSVVADGTLPLAYQWRLSGTNLADGGNISGSTSPELTIANVQRTNAGSYQVMVSNVAGTTNSETATLSVVGLIQSWVNAATNGQVIPIPAGTYVENVVIDKDVTLEGAGAEVTIVDGDKEDRVFVIATNRTVALTGLTVQHQSGVAIFRGGGIYSQGDLLLTDCVIQDNGEPITTGGGIFSEPGNLTLSNCVVRSNAAGQGGGIFFAGGQLVIRNSLISSNNSGFGGGGIDLDSGTMTMEDSTAGGNLSNGGGGILVKNSATAHISRSTISGNRGFDTPGGGILNSGATSLTNCTLSGNTTRHAGGGGIGNFGLLTLNHCTITANSVGDNSGGGVWNAGTLNVQNSLIAGNQVPSGFSSPDVQGALASQGYNLIGNTNGATITGDLTGNLLAVDPLLGPLENNGGPTWTHALLTGSPAIDQGSAGGLVIDQRGVVRPVDDPAIPNAADGSDIGAVEQRALSLSEISVQGGGTIAIRIEGDPGLSYELQVSADFLQWQIEAVLITGPDGLATYTLPAPEPSSARFFRLLRR